MLSQHLFKKATCIVLQRCLNGATLLILRNAQYIARRSQLCTHDQHYTNN